MSDRTGLPIFGSRRRWSIRTNCAAVRFAAWASRRPSGSANRRWISSRQSWASIPWRSGLKNCLDTGDETPAGDRANHIALRQCLLEVSRELKRWKKRAPSDHGFGVALIHKSPTTSAASSKALLRIRADAGVELMIGATDVGGGTGTTLGQIAAEILGIAPTDIRVVIADTDGLPSITAPIPAA